MRLASWVTSADEPITIDVLSKLVAAIEQRMRTVTVDPKEKPKWQSQ
jgi:hypothetical protein